MCVFFNTFLGSFDLFALATNDDSYYFSPHLDNTSAMFYEDDLITELVHGNKRFVMGKEKDSYREDTEKQVTRLVCVLSLFVIIFAM